MRTDDASRTVFVFVRSDLPLADQIVQVGHACLAGASAFAAAPSCRLVLIGVADRAALRAAVCYCEAREIRTVAFHEPDSVSPGSPPMGLTAVCTEPLPDDLRRRLRKFRLWTGP
jgi:hypothetical protein